MNGPILETNLPFPVRRGKVRDVYDVGEHLLLVATDRISAYDCVMPNGIPDKGKLLTQLSLFWSEFFKNDVPNHLVATDVSDFPQSLQPHRDVLHGRSVLVKRAEVIPFECVVRGYLAGSGWQEYKQHGTLAGEPLPAGLRLADKLPEPQFTPATKAESGHDENVSYAEMAASPRGARYAEELRRLTLHLYRRAADYAATRGIVLADTKFEFGMLPDGRVIVIDEMLTPDSSRFWPADQVVPGEEPPSFDKQFVRNWLTEQPWDRTPPAPALPPEVVEGTRGRYVEAYETLTGNRWEG